jgi:hypothetical protein
MQEIELQLKRIADSLEKISNNLEEINNGIKTHESPIPKDMIKAITITNLKQSGLYDEVMKEMIKTKAK